MLGANLTFSKMITPLAWTKDPLSQPTFIFLVTTIPCVGSRSIHVNILPCLGWCTIQDTKGASTSRALAPSRGLIEVIHVVKHLAKLGQTASRVLTVALVLDLELEASPPKKWQWEEECLGFTGKDKALFNPSMMH